jgi:hypothetical protein
LLVNDNCFLGLDGGFLFGNFQPQRIKRNVLSQKSCHFFGKNTFGVNFTTCHKTFCQFSLVSIAFYEHFAN